MSAMLTAIPAIEPVLVAVLQFFRPEAAIRCHSVIEPIISVCAYIPS